MNLIRLHTIAIISVMLILFNLANAVNAQSGVDFERISRATVFVLQTRDFGDDVIVCVGSGTIVDPSGLILTNAHHTSSNSNCSGQSLVIALSPAPNTPPIPRYRAEIANIDRGLDLALLRITTQLDGRPLDREALSLPFVVLADSSTVRLDDTVRVFGYPDVFSAPVEERVGVINGFITEPSATGRAWIKIDSDIPGSMTGGGVYNELGQMVGIPTTVALNDPDIDASCQIIQDTNEDNFVNEDDACVPIGGFVNTARPANLARLLLRSASLDLQVEQPLADNMVTLPVGDPGFSRLMFSTSVRNQMPTQVVSAIPSTSSLFLFFDYMNMTPETIYELRVTINGVLSPVFSLSPVRWSGGQNGLWYIGTDEQNWPNGEYEFSLFIDGILADATTIRTGVPNADAPAFNNILFGADETFSGTGYLLPTGNVVNARFNFNNMQEGIDWTAIWYFNGAEIPGSRTDNQWQAADGVNGSFILPIVFEDGLISGRYRLELYLNDGLAATADFTVVGARQGAFPRVFTNERSVEANTTQSALIANESVTFASGTPSIYVLFDWEQIAPGTLWTVRWLVDGGIFYEETRPWTQPETGENYPIRLTSPSGLLDGTYILELLINDIPLTSTELRVGIGQLPLEILAESEGVQLQGQLIDFETGEGIAGLTFVLISEDFSVADFTWDQQQIYSIATTDLNGRFQLERLLQFGSPYSVVIAGRGYIPVSADGIIVDEDTPNPLEITIYMVRD